MSVLLRQPGGYEGLRPLEAGPDSLSHAAPATQDLAEPGLDRSPVDSPRTVARDGHDHKFTGGAYLPGSHLPPGARVQHRL